LFIKDVIHPRPSKHPIDIEERKEMPRKERRERSAGERGCATPALGVQGCATPALGGIFFSSSPLLLCSSAPLLLISSADGGLPRSSARRRLPRSMAAPPFPGPYSPFPIHFGSGYYQAVQNAKSQ